MDNFEPLNNDFEPTDLNFDNFEPSQNIDENFSEKYEEKNSKKNFIIFSVVIFIFLAVIYYCVFFQSKNNTNDYMDVIAERPAPSNRIYQLNIKPNKSILKEGERFKFDIARTIHFSGDLKEVTLSFKIPVNIPNRQKIDNLVITPTPNKIEKKEDGTYAYIFVKRPKGNLDLHLAGYATVYCHNEQNARKYGKNIDGILSDEDRIIYTSPDDKIESNNKLIKSTSAKYIPKATNDLDTIKNIFDYVVENIRYNKKDIGANKGAFLALASKRGVCMEFSNLMVAFCRTKGIPARVVYGFDIPLIDMERLSNSSHAWVEAYTQEFGWVTFDATNKISPTLFKKLKKLNITPYELFAYAFQNRIYLTADLAEIYMTYKGEGNIKSDDIIIKFSAK